jgi:hypothetical protein
MAQTGTFLESVSNLLCSLRFGTAHIDDVFEFYEADIARMQSEIQASRADNRLLTDKLRALVEAGITGGGPGGMSGTPSGMTNASSMADGVGSAKGGASLRGVSVRRIMEKLHAEIDMLRAENEGFRSAQRCVIFELVFYACASCHSTGVRQYQRHKRCFEDASRKVTQLSRYMPETNGNGLLSDIILCIVILQIASRS